MRIERSLTSRTRLGDSFPGVRALSPTDRDELEAAYSEAEDFSPFFEQALGFSLSDSEGEKDAHTGAEDAQPGLNLSLAPVFELSELTRGQTSRRLKSGLEAYSGTTGRRSRAT